MLIGTIAALVLGLLIAYLPTIYSAFSRREVMVGQLATFTGQTPSGVEILRRAHMMERFQLLEDLWVQWQGWFAELEETHTSLAVVNFFRSPAAHRSWASAKPASFATAVPTPTPSKTPCALPGRHSCR